MREGIGAVLLACALAASLSPGVSAGERSGGTAKEPLDESFLPDRLVVGVADDASARDLAEFTRVLAAWGLRLRRAIPQLGAFVYDVEPAKRDGALAALDPLAAVHYAERDPRVTAAQRIPNDPAWGDQWGAELIGAPDAWTTTTGTPAVVVAVLDTGVFRTHEDIDGATAGGINIVEPGLPPEDRHGHGTMSAGVVAARTDNERGMAGVCWTCTVMPVKVLGDDGDGAMSDVAAGLVWATDNGAQIASMSLGGAVPGTLLTQAVAYADLRDVLLVGAAGNAGVTEEFYPGAFPQVIAVAGSDHQDRRYSWSNHGDWVDLAAPGCNIATSLANRYAFFCGTSSATPLVAGVAALLRASSPSLASHQVAAVLRETALPLGFVRFGRIDAAEAVVAELSLDPILEPLDPLPLPGPELPLDQEPEDEPTAGTTIIRIAGVDRYATAALVSARHFDPPAARVYVATGHDFPDALAAGAAAARFGAPVLITDPHAVPVTVRDELARLAPEELVVVGGAAAISFPVEQELTAAAGNPPTRRLAGEDRFATAALIAEEAFRAPVPVVYIATGEGFADALAGVPAAAWEGGPVLLTARDHLPAPTSDVLRLLQPQRIVVLGGEQAVSGGVEETLRQFAQSGEVTRHRGADRFATAAAVVAAVFPADAQATYLATGRAFPDALSGGAAAATRGAAVLLVEPDRLPPPADEQLRRLRPNELIVLGGEVAISRGVAITAAESASTEQPE